MGTTIDVFTFQLSVTDGGLMMLQVIKNTLIVGTTITFFHILAACNSWKDKDVGN